MSDQSAEENLVEEVSDLEQKIRSDTDSLRQTFHYDVDDLVRLGEIRFTGDFEHGTHADKARSLFSDIIETVSEDQVDELTSRAISQFTPATLYVTGSAIYQTDYFPSEIVDLIPEIVDVLSDDRSNKYVNQKLALLLSATAEHSPNALDPHIEELSFVLRREVRKGRIVPCDRALVEAFEKLSETSTSSLTQAVDDLIIAAQYSNPYFARRALMTLRRIAESDPLAFNNSVSDLEPLIENVVESNDIDSLIEICRILVSVQGEQALRLLRMIDESSENRHITDIVSDAHNRLKNTDIDQKATTYADSAQSKTSTSSEGPPEELAASTAYSARLLSSHLHLNGGEDCTEVIQWLQEMDEFLSTYPIDIETVSEIQESIEENIILLSDRSNESLTDEGRIDSIRMIANRFEQLYVMNT